MTIAKEIFVRPERCMGCSSCKLSCAVEHSRTKNLHTAMYEHPGPKARLFIEWLDVGNKVPVVCRQCEDAPCLNACICGAISKNAAGVAITDQDKCIGCWTCVMVCPYGVIARDRGQAKACRCDRCQDLETPACVTACPTGALVYENVETFSAVRRKKAAEVLLVEGEEA